MLVSNNHHNLQRVLVEFSEVKDMFIKKKCINKVRCFLPNDFYVHNTVVDIAA